MRGYAAAFQTWKHLGLDGHQVKYFIHTWEDTGWRFPDPMSGNGVDRIFKFAPFAEAYRQAGFRYGLAAMKKAYPNFFARLEVSSTLGEADLRAVYGADAVVAIARATGGPSSRTMRTTSSRCSTRSRRRTA